MSDDIDNDEANVDPGEPERGEGEAAPAPQQQAPAGSSKIGSGSTTGRQFVPPTPEELDAVLEAYEFLEIIGKGGMGAVYKARQPKLDRLVAIKVLPAHLQIDDDDFNFAKRFMQEAQAMAKLTHPHILHVYDFGETDDGQLYFVMEFVDGTDLHQLIRGGNLTIEHFYGWIPQICSALQYAHSEGIVHRDIKPSNVMITKKGEVKIADFGLAKLTGADHAHTSKLTMTNMAMGTPDYVAPEQLVEGAAVDHRADLYSLGVLLYEMLTGSVPRGRFKRPSVKVPGLDERLDDVVFRAMEEAPEERFQHAGEISTAISQIKTSPPGSTGPVQVTAKKRPALVTGPVPNRPGSAPGGSGKPPKGATAPVRPSPGRPPKGATGPVKPGAAKRAAAAKGQPKSKAGLWIGVTTVAALAAVAAVIFKGDGDGSGDGGGASGDTTVTQTSPKPKPKSDPKPKPQPKPKPPSDPKEGTGTNPGIAAPILAGISTGQPFENSLGMKFVPVPITGGPTDSNSSGKAVLFSVWETRRRDYQVFVDETKLVWPEAEWKIEGFEETPDHPAVMVSWEEAERYCEWLTEKERKQGKIGAADIYRLPSDHEWSCAAGIGDKEDASATPQSKSEKVKGYTWGSTWPPATAPGNYYGEESTETPYAGPGGGPIAGFSDTYPRSSPVGSFPPSQLGLYDLGGNAWEWCSDTINGQASGSPVLRGAAWVTRDVRAIPSSRRAYNKPDSRNNRDGFRVVLEVATGSPLAEVADAENGEWIDVLGGLNLGAAAKTGEWILTDEGLGGTKDELRPTVKYIGIETVATGDYTARIGVRGGRHFFNIQIPVAETFTQLSFGEDEGYWVLDGGEATNRLPEGPNVFTIHPKGELKIQVSLLGRFKSQVQIATWYLVLVFSVG